MKIDKRRQILSKFLGYGNSENARIVFIGIEPGGNFWRLEKGQLQQYCYEEKEKRADRRLLVYEKGCVNHLLPFEYWHEELQIEKSEYDKKAEEWSNNLGITERMQIYLSMKIRKEIFKEDIDSNFDIKKYYVNHFCREKELQINLSPVAKPKVNTDYGKDVLDYLCLESKDDVWKEFVTGKRCNLLNKVCQDAKKNDSYFFVIGRNKLEEYIRPIFDYWNNFPSENCLPSENFPVIQHGNKRIHCYWSDKGRVWFLPHPSHGWIKKELIDFIVNQIKKLNPNP
ncbi:MAG: hypothetical protein KGZ58_07310 [Ignavibacteriales bacterium]|nr:hypothetical protein [Ignavibacteriales bacterium]